MVSDSLMCFVFWYVLCIMLHFKNLWLGHVTFQKEFSMISIYFQYTKASKSAVMVLNFRKYWFMAVAKQAKNFLCQSNKYLSHKKDCELIIIKYNNLISYLYEVTHTSNGLNKKIFTSNYIIFYIGWQMSHPVS